MCRCADRSRRYETEIVDGKKASDPDLRDHGQEIMSSHTFALGVADARAGLSMRKDYDAWITSDQRSYDRVRCWARLPETFLPKLPRMALFALWATACEPEFWPSGTFWTAYCGNRDEAVEGVIDAHGSTGTAEILLRAVLAAAAISPLSGALAEHYK